MSKKISIEYAHIYTNNHIGNEQKLSLDVLSEVAKNHDSKDVSLVVMIDDYSFPDPSFDYEGFIAWLTEHGFQPDVVLRESQLIPYCDKTIGLIGDDRLKEQISDYVRGKKYPCSLFIATWYLIRLGFIQSSVFNQDAVAEKIINILPFSFKNFEDKALEIIKSTKFNNAAERIENKYFEGRLIA